MQDSATTGPIGKAGADDAGAGKRKRPGWDNLSYTTRVTAAFAFIAAMTALVAIGVVSFVWEQHFQTYLRSCLPTRRPALWIRKPLRKYVAA